MTFQFTSGPSFVITFISLFAYAVIAHATFEAYAVWAVSLFTVHVGKRLYKAIKVGQTELTNGETNGTSLANGK